MSTPIAPPCGSVRPIFGHSLPRLAGSFIELYQGGCVFDVALALEVLSWKSRFEALEGRCANAIARCYRVEDMPMTAAVCAQLHVEGC